MAAFVAVADDASAVVVESSGLVHGPFFNLSLTSVVRQRRPSARPRLTGERRASQPTLIALGAAAVGVSYYRMGTDGSSSPSALQASSARTDKIGKSQCARWLRAIWARPSCSRSAIT